MSRQYINRANDDDIIDIMRDILSNGNMVVETFHESILVKLMELRCTPIKVHKYNRSVDDDFYKWTKENEAIPLESDYCTCDPRMNAPNSSGMCFFCYKPIKRK